MKLGLKIGCLFSMFTFLKNADIADNWSSAKQGFERMMLDAIYNDGDIQEIHKVMGKPVKRWLLEFSNVFTLNYDNNIEDLIKRPVFHLHGDFRTPANSENPQTLIGHIRKIKGENVDIPHQFEHCFCDALFDYVGEHKYDIALAFEKGAEGLLSLEKSGVPSVLFPAQIEELLRFIKSILNSLLAAIIILPSSENWQENFTLSVCLPTTTHAYFLSWIDGSNIERLCSIITRKKAKKRTSYSQKSSIGVQELWKQLKALPKQYNCNYDFHATEADKAKFEALNLMSGDKVSESDIIKCANSIPRFEVTRLYGIAKNEMLAQKERGHPKDAEDQQRQFHEIMGLH